MKVKSLIIVAMLLFSMPLYITGSAQGAEPGTVSDPVVSKSYVDQRINEVLSVLGQSIGDSIPGSSINTDSNINPDSGINLENITADDIMMQLDFLISERLKTINFTTDSYIPVEVLAGQTLYGHEGTEIILRRGKGVAVTSTDGIVNATTGTELKNGYSVAINNLLIIPRTDGRGVRVTESAWFIVKGSYTVE